MKKSFTWILILIAPLAAIGQTDVNYDSIVAGIKNKSEKMINYFAEVELMIYSDLFLEPSAVSYEMSYVKPDKFRIEKKEGDFETIIINNNEVFRSENKGDFVSMGEVGVLNMFNELMSQIISGDFFDNDDFEVGYSIQTDTYELRLTPKRKALARRIMKIELVLDKSSFSVKEFIMFETEQNYFEYQFRSIDYNTDVSPKLFMP